MIASVRENRAGYWKAEKEATEPSCLPRMEKKAPIIGPNRNPRENATPIRACTGGIRKYVSLL